MKLEVSVRFIGSTITQSILYSKRILFALLMTVPVINQACGDTLITRDVGYRDPLKQPFKITFESLLAQFVSGTTTTIFAGAAVEPSIAVNPKNPNKIVAAWQQGRISNGGALEIGTAHSEDGGKTWKRSTIPLQLFAGGIIQRSSDSWLSYSADGKKVYLMALVFNATTDTNTLNQQGVIVSMSEDNGVNWGVPQFLSASEAAIDASLTFALDDKTAITADPNHRKNAYAVWTHFVDSITLHGTVFFSRTTDQGEKWSTSRQIYDATTDLLLSGLSDGDPEGNTINSNVVVVLPTQSSNESHCHCSDSSTNVIPFAGSLLNFMTRQYLIPGADIADYPDTFPSEATTANDIAFIRSVDLGVNWDSRATIVAPLDNAVVFTGGYTYSGGVVTGGIGTLLRTENQLAAYSVNRSNGYLYAVYQTGLLRSDRLPQVALVTSRDGGSTWSTPVRVNRTPNDSVNQQAFTPFVAVTDGGRVGILYFDFRNDDKSNPDRTNTDAWLAIYKEVSNPNGGDTGVGLEFVKEVRLTKKSFIAQNGPDTTSFTLSPAGNMVAGDYAFLVAEKENFYAIYTPSFDGPFEPATTIFNDGTSVILLDANLRTSPNVSILKRKKCKH